MKKILILITMVLLFSCTKIEPTIAWEKNVTFGDVLKSASEKYVMIDFVRDG